MAWMTAIGPCVVCKRNFTFNPERVPSVRVKGVREPVCESCLRQANVERKKRGMAPFPEPHPDAYGAEEVC